jgi:hypothetical protein
MENPEKGEDAPARGHSFLRPEPNTATFGGSFEHEVVPVGLFNSRATKTCFLPEYHFCRSKLGNCGRSSLEMSGTPSQ